MQNAAEQTQPQDRSTRCLIIEDSAFDCARMTRVLNKSRHAIEIDTATTLEAARDILARGETALILLDNNLPDGLGANFALELSRTPDLADIPIIIVSDWPSPFMWEKAAAAGVAYVVNKSQFDTRYVHAVLQGKRARSLH